MYCSVDHTTGFHIHRGGGKEDVHVPPQNYPPTIFSLKVLVNDEQCRTFDGKDPPCDCPECFMADPPCGCPPFFKECFSRSNLPHMVVHHVDVLDYCRAQLHNVFLV